MMNVLDKFITLITSQKGCGYVYGAQGEIMTKEYLSLLVKMYGRNHYYFTGYSAEKWLGKVSYDCSGLIVWALQKIGILNKNEDYTAGGLYTRMCIPISKPELLPGDLVFKETSSGIVHVGMYICNNEIIHARGTRYGVVETNLFATFNKFGRIKALIPTKPWEQLLGENAIDQLAAIDLINDGEFWKKQDLKNTNTPLWLFFEMQHRIYKKINENIKR